jgi:hypothetical protein
VPPRARQLIASRQGIDETQVLHVAHGKTEVPMRRAFLEVVPAEDGWLIRMAGNSASEHRATKAEAIQRARELGRRHDMWRVRVLTKTGRVEREISSPQAPTGGSLSAQGPRSRTSRPRARLS